jgi:hypothetical protein
VEVIGVDYDVWWLSSVEERMDESAIDERFWNLLFEEGRSQWNFWTEEGERRFRCPSERGMVEGEREREMKREREK